MPLRFIYYTMSGGAGDKRSLPFRLTPPSSRGVSNTMSYVEGAGVGCAPVGGAFTSTNAILVLFILLVIIISSFCF